MLRNMTPLTYKSCWQAPGYRSPTLTFTDAAGKEYECTLTPKELQLVIYECAEAARGCGGKPPIDWDKYPTRVVWPQVTPWVDGPSKKAGA